MLFMQYRSTDAGELSAEHPGWNRWWWRMERLQQWTISTSGALPRLLNWVSNQKILVWWVRTVVNHHGSRYPDMNKIHGDKIYPNNIYTDKIYPQTHRPFTSCQASKSPISTLVPRSLLNSMIIGLHDHTVKSTFWRWICWKLWEIW